MISQGKKGVNDRQDAENSDAGIRPRRSTWNSNCEVKAHHTQALVLRKVLSLSPRSLPNSRPLVLLKEWPPPRLLNMQITDNDAAELKIWIVKKLENMYVGFHEAIAEASVMDFIADGGASTAPMQTAM